MDSTPYLGVGPRSMLLAPPSPDTNSELVSGDVHPEDERDAAAREVARSTWLGQHRWSVVSTTSTSSTGSSELAVVEESAASSEEAVDDGEQEKEQKEGAGQPEAQSIGESSSSEEDLDAGGELSTGGGGCLACVHRFCARSFRGSTRKI